MLRWADRSLPFQVRHPASHPFLFAYLIGIHCFAACSPGPAPSRWDVGRKRRRPSCDHLNVNPNSSFPPQQSTSFGHPLRLPSRVPFVAGEVKMKIRIANAAGAILLASAMATSAQTGSSTPNTARSATAPNSATASTGQDQTGAAAKEPLRQQVRDNLAK